MGLPIGTTTIRSSLLGSIGYVATIPAVSVCPSMFTSCAWWLNSCLQARGMSESKGSLADKIKRRLFSSNSARRADGKLRKASTQLRQYEGTMSMTVTENCLIVENSSIGSLISSVLATTTPAPSVKGSSNCLTDDEKEIEAVCK